MRRHTVYSENFALLGLQPYTVRAFLTNYPTTTSATKTAQIKFMDPCPDPESVLSVLQTNPADYYYTLQSPKMKFTLKPYVVEPPVCVFVYSCAVTAGARTDLCSINDGTTQGVFDPITGNYEFYSIDMANYTPGSYTFTITGTVGTKSATATFVMKLVNPCPTTLLTVNNPAPFVTQTYILRDPQINRVWNIATIVTKGTLVNCGTLIVEFFDNNTGIVPDPAIFEDSRVPGTNNFASLFTADSLKRGNYPIRYRAYY